MPKDQSKSTQREVVWIHLGRYHLELSPERRPAEQGQVEGDLRSSACQYCITAGKCVNPVRERKNRRRPRAKLLSRAMQLTNGVNPI